MSDNFNVRKSKRLREKNSRVNDDNIEKEKVASARGSVRSSTCSVLRQDRTNKEIQPCVNQTDMSQTYVSNTKNSEHKSNRSSRKMSTRRRLEIEAEIRRKELEHRHQQEMLELEHKLQLAKLEEDGETTDSESIECESNISPNIKKWVDDKVNPWDRRSDRLKHTSQFMKQEPEVGVNPIASHLVAKILTRQSLPKDLPTFSGDPSEWPNFIFQYNNSTDICGYSEEENQYRLQKCLKGQARKIVESLLILPHNADKIIEILKNRFGRPEFIIFSLINKIKHIPQVKEDRLNTLINFSDEVKNLVGTLESLNEEDHLRNPILLQELVNRLPTSYKLNWVECISNKDTFNYKLKEFSLWLDKKAQAACQIQISNLTEDQGASRQRSKRDVTLVMTNQACANNKNCICCKCSLHSLDKCAKFRSFSNDEKWKFVTKQRFCFACLYPFHQIKLCKKKKPCGIGNCSKLHHNLLHKEINNQVQNDTEKETNVEVTCHIASNKNVLLKILPVVISTGNNQINTYALLDDASTVTLIDQDLANELNLDGPEHALCLQWTNNQTTQQENSKIVSCTIRGPTTHKKFVLRHVRTIKGMSLPMQTIDINKICQKYPYIQNNTLSMTNAVPRILIGQDNWPLLINRKVITGPWNGPVVSKTLLGWVLHGNINTDTINPKVSNPHYVCHIRGEEKDDLDILHDMIKSQWKIENTGLQTTKTMSKEDLRAQSILDRTMKRVGDRYETGLLWKDENLKLPESKSNALKRLLSLEKKLDRYAEFGRIYCEKMLDLQNKNYIKKLSKVESEVNIDKIWYLPHFGVVNPNKPNKLRLVFDAKSKSNGVSLNDCLLTGPDLYNSLQAILLNFRIKKYAFTADIREMFLQVKVRKEDRVAQRFLWRGMDRHRPPDVYEIQVVFFGSTSGPCLAQEAKNRNAGEFAKEYPEASKAIIEDHYMDDYLGNADTEAEAKKLISDVIHVHKQGGFIICNWIVNSPVILENIDNELKADGQKDLENKLENSGERILGVWWNPQEDTFSFKTKFHKINKDILDNKRPPTKREVLKVVMSIFDPLGFLANFVIQGKILLQDIWRNKVEWDEEITEHLQTKWKLWINDLKNIYNFKIPRQYFTLNRDESKIQLHVFSDASEKCYAAVAYLRIQHENIIQTSFVCAKTRVAPLKPISIPRLELQGALIGARLGHNLKKTLNLNISNTFYWTDSKTVLQWIRAEAHRFKIYVATRIGEIQDLTNTNDWKYVPSKINVADEATKRSKILEFSTESRWLLGPEFLRKSPQFWPKEKVENESSSQTENHNEIKSEYQDYVLVNFVAENLEIPKPERFSKWFRLLRATAWMLRFIGNCKKNKTIGELECREIQVAEKILYRKAQTDCFYEELYLLKQNKPLSKHSRIYKLNCGLDDDGLIRLSGRLNNLEKISEYTKRPILLDPKHRITQLIIQHKHEAMYHQGLETVVNELRKMYWILHIRQAVKNIVSKCQKCRNKRAIPRIPIMGQLPLCRLEPTVRCFLKCGVDYFGPLLVTVKRGHEKRYGVIFTCMVTRAIHLEIAHDLTTNSFIHVLRQFGCRRGFPEEMYSDNGGNFKMAEKELSDSLSRLNQTEIKKFCAMKNIKWNFNPPCAPHMGGSWERLIQTVKKIMKEMLTSRYPQEYVLRTIFAEAENIINSRPLTHISIDSEDSEALTPNHFLIGHSYAAVPCTMSEEANLSLLSKWKASQKLADYFWRRWTQEYVPELLTRNKWHEQTKSIKEDDIVILVDPSGPRNTWPKGRVIKLYPGKDGQTRVVDVKLANGTILRRPVSRLCVLEVLSKKNAE